MKKRWIQQIKKVISKIDSKAILAKTLKKI